MNWSRLGLMAVLALTACAPSAAPSAPTGGSAPPAEVRADNQVLRIGVGFGPSSMSAAAALTPIPFQHWPLYDNLTSFGPNFEVRPGVATKWDVSADGKTWTFTIRDDMTFSNGDKLSAEDVAFTFGEMREKRWFNSGGYGNIASARAVDATTFEMVARAADMTVPYIVTTFWVAPKGYYTQVGPDAYRDKPIGSGPYELLEFKANDVIRFKKRSAAHAFRKPANDEIIFRVVPDAGQRINGLRGGELDILAQTAFTVDQLDQLKAAGISLISNLTSVQILSIPEGTANQNNTPLKDKRVRQALNYAIDKEGFTKTFYKEGGQALGQVSLPGSLYFDPTVQPVPFNPARAKELLAQAGYPNGFAVTLGQSSSQNVRDLVLAIQSNLREVGVTVNVEDFEGGDFSDRAVGAKNTVKSDLWMQITSDTNGFGSSIRTFYGCGKPVNAAPNAAFYCNPEWDKLMDAAIAERDQTKRVQLLRDANKLQREDAPAVPLLATALFVGSGPKIKGVTIPSPLMYNFDSAYRIQ